jgi:hypothetical protein
MKPDSPLGRHGPPAVATARKHAAIYTNLALGGLAGLKVAIEDEGNDTAHLKSIQTQGTPSICTLNLLKEPYALRQRDLDRRVSLTGYRRAGFFQINRPMAT